MKVRHIFRGKAFWSRTWLSVLVSVSYFWRNQSVGLWFSSECCFFKWTWFAWVAMTAFLPWNAPVILMHYCNFERKLIFILVGDEKFPWQLKRIIADFIVLSLSLGWQMLFILSFLIISFVILLANICSVGRFFSIDSFVLRAFSPFKI